MSQQLSYVNASKDRLIEEMRRENEELRENEKDYADLNFLLTNLESRYAVLNDEKRQQEIEFQERLDGQNKMIGQMHNEIEGMKESLRVKQDALDMAMSELAASKEVAEHKHLNTDRLKTELKQAFDMNQRLREDNQSMESQLRWHKEEKKSLNDRIDKLTKTVSEVMEKKEDIERMFEESEKDRRSIEQLHRELECEFEILNEETAKKGSRVGELQSDCDRQQQLLDRQQSQMERLQQENKDMGNQNAQLNAQYNQISKQLNEVRSELKELQGVQRQQKQYELDAKEENTRLHQQVTRMQQELEKVCGERLKYSELNAGLTEELNGKHSLLQELQNQAANALQTILRLEQENKDTINDYQWIKAELEDNNTRAKAEINRNIDLVKVNRDLEESLMEMERRLQSAQAKESELICRNQELEQLCRRQKNELEEQRVELKDQKCRINEVVTQLKEKDAKLGEVQSKGTELQGKLQSSESALKELRGQLRNLAQQSALKDDKMTEIEIQSQSSLETLVKLEEEHRRQQSKNERLREELADARERLARMEGQSQVTIHQLKEERVQELNEQEELHARLRKELQEKNQKLQETINQLSAKLDQSFEQNTKLQMNNEQLSSALAQVEYQEKELNQLIDQKQALRQARMKEEQHLKVSLNQLKSTLSAASVQNNRNNNALLFGRDSRGRKEAEDEEEQFNCEDASNYRYGAGSQEHNTRKQHQYMNNRRDNYSSFSNRNNFNNSNEGSLFFNKDGNNDGGIADRKTLPKHRTGDYSNY